MEKTSHITVNQELEVNVVEEQGLVQASEAYPSDLPAIPYLLKVPQPTKIVPPSGGQAFNT